MKTGQIKKIAFTLLVLSLLPLAAQDAQARRPKHVKLPIQTCQSHKTMDKITSFTYHQSGGFAAINRTYSVKLADLTKEEREKLESLIQTSGLLSIKKENKTTPGAADMFFYEFTALNGGEHTASFDDGTLPAPFRPLVEYARAKAVTAK